jgi:hypothetical protein
MNATPAITRLVSTTNAAVVQLPERQYPGVVIQGDSLHNLSNLLNDAAAQMHLSEYDEATSIVEEVREIVAGYVAAYDAAVIASTTRGPKA